MNMSGINEYVSCEMNISFINECHACVLQYKGLIAMVNSALELTVTVNSALEVIF